MRFHQAPTVAGVVVSLAMLAAGCGGSAGSGPVSESAAIGGEEFGLTMGELSERAEDAERLIGECMSVAGFEYVPVDFSTIRDAMTSDKTAAGMSGAEFRAEFGYGISTQEAKPIVELGRGAENIVIFEALSAADQAAYQRTLYGTDLEATLAYSLELEDLSRTGGCTREALTLLFTSEELAVTYLNPGDALVESDLRVLAAGEAFAACMQAAGFEYAHPDGVEDSIYERYMAITDGEPIDSLTAAAQAELQTLQDHERAVAPVAQQCEIDVFEPVADLVEREVFGS